MTIQLYIVNILWLSDDLVNTHSVVHLYCHPTVKTTRCRGSYNIFGNVHIPLYLCKFHSVVKIHF